MQLEKIYAEIFIIILAWFRQLLHFLLLIWNSTWCLIVSLKCPFSLGLKVSILKLREENLKIAMEISSFVENHFKNRSEARQNVLSRLDLLQKSINHGNCEHKIFFSL